jgi:hypothetical protein
MHEVATAQREIRELVWASVGNPLENPRSGGKRRPVVLIARDEGHWQVMGLTTRSTYSDGSPRTPVPNPGKVGPRQARIPLGRQAHQDQCHGHPRPHRLGRRRTRCQDHLAGATRYLGRPYDVATRRGNRQASDAYPSSL